MAKATNITIIGNDKRYSYEFETDLFAFYENIADKHDEAFIKMFNLENMYKIVDDDDSIEEHASNDNAPSLNIKLKNCLRDSTYTGTEWSINAITDCAVDMDIDPLNVYKWLKFVIYFTSPIFNINKQNEELDISDEDVDATLSTFMDNIYLNFKNKLYATPLTGIVDKLDVAYKTISESMNQFIPLLHRSNKFYTEHIQYENRDFIKTIMSRYKAILKNNGRTKSLENYKDLIMVFWDFFQEYLPINTIQTAIFSALQVSLILLASNVNITFYGGANYNTDEDVLNTYDVISNIIGNRLKIHLLVPYDTPWIRHVSEMICNTKNEKLPIAQTKEYITNTLYKKFKNEFNNMNVTNKRLLYNSNEERYNDRMESFFVKMSEGNEGTYYLNEKITELLNQNGDDLINRTLSPFVIFIDADRTEYLLNSVSLSIATSQRHLSQASQISFLQYKKMTTDLTNSIKAVSFIDYKAMESFLNKQMSQSIYKAFIESNQGEKQLDEITKTIKVEPKLAAKKKPKRKIIRLYNR